MSGVRCGIAQGGSCGVRTHGKTRVRARESPTRDSATWVPSQGTITGYRHRVSTQGTATGYLQRILPRINAAAQHHSGT